MVRVEDGLQSLPVNPYYTRKPKPNLKSPKAKETQTIQFWVPAEETRSVSYFQI